MYGIDRAHMDMLMLEIHGAKKPVPTKASTRKRTVSERAMTSYARVRTADSRSSADDNVVDEDTEGLDDEFAELDALSHSTAGGSLHASNDESPTRSLWRAVGDVQVQVCGAAHDVIV